MYVNIYYLFIQFECVVIRNEFKVSNELNLGVSPFASFTLHLHCFDIDENRKHEINKNLAARPNDFSNMPACS